MKTAQSSRTPTTNYSKKSEKKSKHNKENSISYKYFIEKRKKQSKNASLRPQKSAISTSLSKIIDLTTSSSEDGQQSKSFDKSSVVFSNITSQVENTNSQLESTTSIDSSISKESDHFDSVLHPLFMPSGGYKTEKKSHPLIQIDATNNKSSEEDFNDFMAKILSPNLQQADHKEAAARNLQSPSQSPPKNSEEMTFDELLEQMLSPNPYFQSGQVNDSTKTPDNRDSQPLSQTVDTVTNDPEPTFEQLLDKMLTPDLSTSLKKQKEQRDDCIKKSFKEISTQTSFDQNATSLVVANLSQNVATNSISKNTPEREYRYAPFMYLRKFTESDDVTNNNIKNTGDTTTTECNAKEFSQVSVIAEEINRDELPPTGKVKHILDVLSHDIITMPNGLRIFNNITKVGTENWLRSVVWANDLPTRFKKGELVDIVETQNYYNNYIDNSTIPKVERKRKGKIKICKINRTKARKINNSQSSELFSSVFDADDVNSSESTDELTKAEQKLRVGIDNICINSDLISFEKSIHIVDKNKIKSKIHHVFGKVYDAFQNNKMPRLLIRRQAHVGHCIFKDRRLQWRPSKEVQLRQIGSRGKRLYYILYVLGKIYTLLEDNSKLTKREMFYQIKDLVKGQWQVDGFIQDVTRLLCVGMWDLNIVAHCGLVYGNLRLLWASGRTTDCNAPATLIPYDLDDLVEVQSTAFFILVVEKESIFHKLLEEDLPNKLTRPFIMITGKGIPDLNTRRFLKKICTLMSLPVFILVDADVSGIRIMLTYKFGCIASCHLSDHLAIPNARWLGVFPSEILKYGMTYQCLSQRDKVSINLLLNFPYMEEEPRLMEELKCLLNSNKKASIEGLIKNNTFLSESYLPIKFFNQDFI